MSARRSKTKTTNRADEASSSVSNRLGLVLGILVVALFGVRWLLPTEVTPEGTTVWIVLWWLVTLGVWFWSIAKSPNRPVILDRFDLMLGFIVLGHLASGIFILIDGGQKRAAINMMWEWVGLGVSFFLLRQILSTRASASRFIGVVISLGFVLAGLGVWQHYVWYPTSAAEYQQLRQRLDEIEAREPAVDSPLRANWAVEHRAARQELLEMGIPPEALDGASRQRVEGRLLHSTEPLGMFGLTNTFAGLLLVLVLLTGCVLHSAWRDNSSRILLALLAIAMAMMLFCLILTESRTAFVGLFAGIVTWGGFAFWQKRTSHASTSKSETGKPSGAEPAHLRIWITGVGCGFVLLLVGLVQICGGLDDEIVSGAPRSLKFRFQYWDSTLEMLRDHPVFGSGPGNFRQLYLKYKKPGASEEIADPHNFVLDLWANGGLLALFGFCLLLLTVGHMVWRMKPTEERQNKGGGEDTATSSPTLIRLSCLLGTAAAFLLVMIVNFIAAEPVETHLWVMFVVAIPLVWMLSVCRDSFRVTSSCIAGGVVALLVHLLGAGGIEMPAIVQLLILMFALIPQRRLIDQAIPATSQNELMGSGYTQRVLILGATVSLVGFVLCLLTAVRPMMVSSTHLRLGDNNWMLRGDVQSAREQYELAAEADPYSPAPHRRLAELSYQYWEMWPGELSSHAKAVEHLRDATACDPLSVTHYRRIGEISLALFDESGDTAAARQAARAFDSAIERYPFNADLLAQLAIARHAAGDKNEARSIAARALALEKLNRAEGHDDLRLASEVRRQLQKIVDTGLDRQDVFSSPD